MGGDLLRNPEASTPVFLIRAVKDPIGANLDRIQIVKGWLDAKGQQHEQIYNAVWSPGRLLSDNDTLPDVGNTVDLDTGRYTNTIGAPALSVIWKDPDFNPDQRAFYYARVLQIPTARHSLFDAIALQADDLVNGPTTIQERAYTSPI